MFLEIPAPVLVQIILEKKDEGCDPRKDPDGCAGKGAPFRGQGRRFSFEPPPNNPRPQCKNRSCTGGGTRFKVALPGVPTLPWCPSDGSIKPPKCRNGSESGGFKIDKYIVVASKDPNCKPPDPKQCTPGQFCPPDCSGTDTDHGSGTR